MLATLHLLWNPGLRVCVVCVFVSVHASVCALKWVCVPASNYVRKCVLPTRTCMRAYASLHVRKCACMCVLFERVCLCVCVCTSARACTIVCSSVRVWDCLSVLACLYVCVSCACVPALVWGRVCAHMWVCVPAGMSACLCISARVCICPANRSGFSTHFKICMGTVQIMVQEYPIFNLIVYLIIVLQDLNWTWTKITQYTWS